MDIELSTSAETPAMVAPGSLERLLRGRLMAQIGQLRGCRLTLDDAIGSVELGTPIPGEEPLRVHLHVDAVLPQRRQVLQAAQARTGTAPRILGEQQDLEPFHFLKAIGYSMASATSGTTYIHWKAKASM